MLHQVRDYWLPLMLFGGAIVAAIVLFALVAAMPIVIEHMPIRSATLAMFAEDGTVRRSSIAGAVGLIVTAFVFFRPNTAVLARKTSKKTSQDFMAGA